MKYSFYLFLITIFIAVSPACKKDNEKSEHITLAQLENSSWAGSLEAKTVVNNGTYDVRITFGPKGYGSLTYRKAGEQERETGSFEYKIDGRSISFDYGYNNLLAGYWLIESSQKEKLRIVRNKENPDNISNLTLTKTL